MSDLPNTLGEECHAPHRGRAAAVVVTLLASIVPLQPAQDYPNRPVTIIVPLAAGSAPIW